MKEKVAEFLDKNFSHFIYSKQEVKSNIPSFFIKPEGIVPVVKALKEEPSLKFDFLNDLTCVDWLGKREPRFEMNYLLKSPSNGHARIMLKVPLDDGESVPSIIGVYKGANWPEREVFDLFGIYFEGHPRMERLIMPDNFQGHPLRKDYPLEGFGQDYLIYDLLQIHQEDKEA
jgi:NADH-quinone oxidoreductase subunit C